MLAKRQALFTAGMRHLRQAVRAGVPLRPKHHLFVHLLHRVREYGNPAFYTTFRDESDNRMLAAVCASAHAAVWEARIFANFGWLARREARVGDRL